MWQDSVFSLIGNVSVVDCVFHNNSLLNGVGGDVAVHLTNHYILSYLNHSVPQFYTSLVNCTIQNSILLVENSFGSTFTGSGAVFVIQIPAGTLFQDCHHDHCHEYIHCLAEFRLWNQNMFLQWYGCLCQDMAAVSNSEKQVLSYR